MKNLGKFSLFTEIFLYINCGEAKKIKNLHINELVRLWSFDCSDSGVHVQL